jgi:hypothetical protein
MVVMEMQQLICACVHVHVCFVELHVTVSKTNMGIVQEYSGQIYVANNNKMYPDLHLRSLI